MKNRSKIKSKNGQTNNSSVRFKVISSLFCATVAGVAAVYCSPVVGVLVAFPAIITSKVFLVSAVNSSKANSIELDNKLRKKYSEQQIKEIYESSGGDLNQVVKCADLAVAGNYLGGSAFCFSTLGSWVNAFLTTPDNDWVTVHEIDTVLGTLPIPYIGVGGAIKLTGAVGVSTILFSLDSLRTINNHQRRVSEAAANTAATAVVPVDSSANSQHNTSLIKHKAAYK